MCVMPQIQQLFRVLIQHLPGIGENALPRRTVKQGLAQFIFQFADGLAHRRLRSVKLLGGPGESVLARNAEKDLQLRKLHLSHLNIKIIVH